MCIPNLTEIYLYWMNGQSELLCKYDLQESSERKKKKKKEKKEKITLAIQNYLVNAS